MEDMRRVNGALQESVGSVDGMAELRAKVFRLEHELIFLRATASGSRVLVLLYPDGYVEVMSRHPVKASVVCVPPGADPEDMGVPSEYTEHLEGKVIASGFPNTMDEAERIDRACAQYIIESTRLRLDGNDQQQ